MLDEVLRGEIVEKELDAMIERRARHNERVNAEATLYRLSTARKAEAQRQENRAAWIEHFRCMALVHHDLAAINAQRADELEHDARGDAARRVRTPGRPHGAGEPGP